MNKHIKEKFSWLWEKYFDGAELPVIFYYTNEEGHAKLVEPGSVPGCVVEALNVLTFSVPMNKFVRMIENSEESFLITDSWLRIQKRIKSA